MTQTNTLALDEPPRVLSARKLGWIATLALAAIVPGFLISHLTGERETYASAARAGIVTGWGPAQRVSGPMLMLEATGTDGTRQYLSLAPRVLETHVTMVPSIRRRGLFTAIVYEAEVAMKGRFELPGLFIDGGPGKLKPGRLFIAANATGIQGLSDRDQVNIAGLDIPWHTCSDLVPGDAGCRRDAGALAAEIDISKVQDNTLPFGLTLHLRGTDGIALATSAKHAVADIEGAWPTPSFMGAVLPASSTVTANHFTAEWVQDRTGRPKYAIALSLAGADAATFDAGVDLLEATPVYRTITRVSKYGLLIVVLAFATYVLFEAVTGLQVALFQYAMLGASLSLFTLLLLSISEITGYAMGYGLSALLILLQASLYTLSVTRRLGPAAVFATMLTAVFGFFYLLAGLESYSLLLGAVALFVLLSAVMATTQSISFGTHRPSIIAAPPTGAAAGQE